MMGWGTGWEKQLRKVTTLDCSRLLLENASYIFSGFCQLQTDVLASL